MKTHGRLWYERGVWKLECAPHVLMWAKRMFHRIPKDASGVIELEDTPSTCRDLEWFAFRFPLELPDEERMRRGSQEHQDHIKSMDEILSGRRPPLRFPMALPPRSYQSQAAELFLSRQSLLLADDVGVGKTATAIAAMTDPRAQPAVVVCPAHLCRQWEREIRRFAPGLRTHIIKQSAYYDWTRRGRKPAPDVVLISYHKLHGWIDVLKRYCRSIILDEVHDVRRSGSDKHKAAASIAEAVDYRMGMSATPIFNYGGEIWNVFQVIAPEALGSRLEFLREWCNGAGGDKPKLSDPEAFGGWLREQHLMLRRTRRDVGRELPELTRITHFVDSDTSVLENAASAAEELAKLILAGGGARGEAFHAAGEFEATMRQATGIAKAPHVAAFVRMILESDEPVVLYGWHRGVYALWLEALKEFNPLLYTGSESASAKDAAVEKFVRGDSNLLIVSLRSGAGLDGLQQRCRTTVFGELDWSYAVHEQCIGRVFRDGQTDPVTAYFLVSEEGADPIMTEVLGLKREQLDGIRGTKPIQQRSDNGESVKKLAREWLNRRKSA